MKFAASLALLCCLAAVAQAGSDRKPAGVLCAARNCYCTPAYRGAAVDCASCRCSACVRPSVAHQDDDDCTPQTIAEQPFYLTRAGTCQRCTAENCDLEEGCNQLGQCKKCARGFARNVATGACVEPVPLTGCDKVDSRNAARCERCTLGWSLNRWTGVCVECTAENAAACDPRYPAVPTACLPGNGLILDPVTRAKSCQACDPANEGCAVCNGILAKCQKCLDLTDAGATEFWVLNPATQTCVAVQL